MVFDFNSYLPHMFSTDYFGVAATYTPNGGGGSSTVNGVLDQEFQEIALGVTYEVASTIITFICASADIATPARGDTFTVSGTDYTAIDYTDDLNGVLTFYLEVA
jgi:hypothetical protein